MYMEAKKKYYKFEKKNKHKGDVFTLRLTISLLNNEASSARRGCCQHVYHSIVITNINQLHINCIKRKAYVLMKILCE